MQPGMRLPNYRGRPFFRTGREDRVRVEEVRSLRLRNDLRDSLAKRRHFQDRLPEFLRVNPPILMLSEGTESSHKIPFDLGVALSEPVGDRARRLAYHFEFANYRTLTPPRAREPLVALLQDLLNPIDGTKDVGQPWPVRARGRQSGTASNST